MAYQLTARTVIESAVLELTGQQLKDLARAKVALADAVTCYSRATGGNLETAMQPSLLTPVVDLVSQIADLVAGASEIRTGTGKKPLSEAALRARVENAAKGRAAMAARNAAEAVEG